MYFLEADANGAKCGAIKDLNDMTDNSSIFIDYVQIINITKHRNETCMPRAIFYDASRLRYFHSKLLVFRSKQQYNYVYTETKLIEIFYGHHYLYLYQAVVDTCVVTKISVDCTVTIDHYNKNLQIAYKVKAISSFITRDYKI